MHDKDQILKSSYCSDNKISRLEGSKGIYNCIQCHDNFSFITWEEFQNHCCHEHKKYFECIYCGLLINILNGERHINMHFQHQFNNLYKCCLCSFTTSSESRFLKHTKYVSHANMKPLFKCHSCKSEFDSIEGLIKHVKMYTVAMFNCCVKNCFVKSQTEKFVLEHNEKIHSSKNQNLEITLFLSCAENSPDNVYTKLLISNYPNLQTIIFHNNIAQKNGLRKELFLECYKCSFCSLNWRSFIKHIVTCKSSDKNDNKNGVYLCSFCHMISTKRDIINEHIFQCDKKATIINENLPQISQQINDKPSILQPKKRNLNCNNGHREEVEENPPKRARVDSTESKYKPDDLILDTELDYIPDPTQDCVSIPFDEDGFVQNSPHIPDKVKDIIIGKMRKLSQHQINIVGKENYGRIPQCPICSKIFQYGFGDFKRHYIAVHLDVDKEFLKDCIKYTKVPKNEDKYQEACDQLAMRNMRPQTLDEESKILLPLPYSIHCLRKLTESLPVSIQQYLADKMRVYSAMTVLIHNSDNSRRFLCNQCSYSSPYALADVRKHIMGSHCGISTKHFRFCLQASRLDPNDFLLLTDERILSFAQDQTRRSKNQSVSYPNKSLLSRSRLNTKKKKNHKSQSFNSNENESPTKENQEYKLFKKESLTSPENGNVTERTENGNHRASVQPSLGGRKGVNALFLNPDQTYQLNLPYSDAVLRKLLTAQFETPEPIEDLIEKMKLYSSYTLKRLCKDDKTVAFQCPCGRVFHTARIPDLKMRAATLADARRHIMGVHAKIPQSLITLCCQASRICRENEFQIYPDEMLLQLANERQGKLAPDSKSTSTTSTTLLRDNYMDSMAPTPVTSTPNETIKQESSLPLSFLETTSFISNIDVSVKGGKNSFLASSFGEESDIANHSLNNTEEPVTQLASQNSPTVTSNSHTAPEEIDENAALRLEEEKGSIERVINLPYSLDALRCLTDGYCEPNFFPVLQEKMEIYSRYKIFIVRRDNKRVFCCSGCPSSSPHGMGDVKKHILGVHARIPERFKAAAMHCSRLSREDTTLLPDHLLLQLAKMKWKGSIIKPLSELSVEDRMKSFSKKTWEGKGRYSSHNFPVNKTSPSVNRKSKSTKTNFLKNSPSKLIVSPPPKYTSAHNESDEILMEDDLSTEDLNGSMSEIVIPDEFHVIIVENRSETMYKCSICSYNSKHLYATKGHIVREHLGIPPYSCNVCDQLFNNRSNAEDHQKKEHQKASCTSPISLTHYGPYRIAMSKIKMNEVSNGTGFTEIFNNGTTVLVDCAGNVIDKSMSGNVQSINLSLNKNSSNSFLQNDFDSSLT